MGSRLFRHNRRHNHKVKVLSSKLLLDLGFCFSGCSGVALLGVDIKNVQIFKFLLDNCFLP